MDGGAASARIASAIQAGVEALASTDATATRVLLLVVATSAIVAVLPWLARSHARLLLTVPCLVAALGGGAPGFLIVGLGTFAAGSAIRRIFRPDARWTLHCGLIVVLVALFFAGREGGCFRAVQVGRVAVRFFDLDMFHLLRLITFVWELGASRIQPTLLTFVFWDTLPITLVGPVLRYSQLQDQPSPSTAPTVGGVARAVLQLAGAVAIGYAVHHVFDLGDVKPGRIGRALLAFNGPPWAFYLQAAGYFTLMERAGLAWGLAIPWSYDRPFFRTNLSDFWANWNATATAVFRDLIFYNRWGLSRPNAYVNIFVLFLACGAWHGANAYWLLWGALHGFGFSAFIAWRRFGPIRLRAWLASPVGCAVSAFVTYTFVCGCWALPNKVLRLLAG